MVRNVDPAKQVYVTQHVGSPAGLKVRESRMLRLNAEQLKAALFHHVRRRAMIHMADGFQPPDVQVSRQVHHRLQAFRGIALAPFGPRQRVTRSRALRRSE